MRHRKLLQEVFDFVFSSFYSEKTSLVYTCPPSRVQKADFFTDGLRVWRENGDYGYGMEDCAILHGIALSGLVDEYEVTGRESAKADARRLVRGLLNLVSAHPYRGYVARGLCEEDGRSICALSSRDQFTHWVHGLWRFRHSRLFDPLFGTEIKKAFGDVADRMLRTVTEENGWMYGQADGSMDPLGITKMAPGFTFSEDGRQLLAEAIAEKPLDQVSTGSTRILHLYAAWWRLMRLGRPSWAECTQSRTT